MAAPMDEKIAALETDLGPRGGAEIHSGKRSALRAWLMARTGRNAASILHIGTAELGAIYNDTTDALLKALPPAGGMPAEPSPKREPRDGRYPGEKMPGDKGEKAEAPKGDKADKPAEAPKGDKPSKVKQPAPPTPSDNAIEDQIRRIAREEDARVVQAVGAALDAMAKEAPPKAADAAPLDEALVRKIAAEEAAKGAPERVIVVKETPKGTERKEAGIQHRMFPLLIKVVEAGLTPALVGPAGSGKTHAAHALSELFGVPFELQGSCITKSDVLGFVDAAGRYQTTPFSRSFVGGGVFLADEMDGWQANATLALNAALANGHTALPTGMVKRADKWYPVVAMNTYGQGASRQYVGRNQMDAATLNRLAFIAWDYDETLEGAIVGVKAPGHGPVDLSAGGIPTVDAWIKRVHAVRAACDRLKVRHIVSPRATIGGAKLFAVGVGQVHAENMLIWQGMDAEQRARVETDIKAARR